MLSHSFITEYSFQPFITQMTAILSIGVNNDFFQKQFRIFFELPNYSQIETGKPRENPDSKRKIRKENKLRSRRILQESEEKRKLVSDFECLTRRTLTRRTLTRSQEKNGWITIDQSSVLTGFFQRADGNHGQMERAHTVSWWVATTGLHGPKILCFDSSNRVTLRYVQHMVRKRSEIVV